MKIFIEKLENIIKELDNLSRFDITSDCYGDDFGGQNEIAASFENLVLVATHETASNLGFMKEDIQLLANYIQFRKKYNYLTEEEFNQIIDNENTNMMLKLEIKKKLNANYLGIVKNIRIEWSQAFHLLSFSKIKEKIKRLKK